MRARAQEKRLFRIAVAIAVLCVASHEPRANQYEAFIDIEEEDDLYDLRLANEISDSTFETLLELLQRGVDLNEADRDELYTLPNLTYAEVDAILQYRDEVGYIDDPSALVATGILSIQKLEAMAIFLIVRPSQPGAFSASGWARFQTRYAVSDDGAPPMAVQSRISTLRNVKVGFAALLERNRLHDVRYDPLRQELSAEAPAARPRLPKAYVAWQDKEFEVIAGTYRIGFGQRLTFDKTDLVDPNGFYGDEEIFRAGELTRRCKESAGELPTSPCTGAAGAEYETPDFSARDGLLGAAISVPELDVGEEGHVEAHAFVSRQPRSIYQYEIYSPERCEDPRNDDDPACSAPLVYRRQDDELEQTSRFSFFTLPDMYTETILGGHVAYVPKRRARVGVTAYRSQVDWLVDGLELDFQEWSATPYGGPFGAVGMDGAFGFRNTDVFAEIAHTYDSMHEDDLGGLGTVARSVTSFGQSEVEVSARYYEGDFANPHARPISAADEFDGNRARDEVGGRVRYNGTLKKRFNLRTNLDVWQTPSDETLETLTYVRGDIDWTDQFRYGLWAQYQDKDLSETGRGQCFEVSTEFDELGEPIPCGGQKIQLTGRFRYAPVSAYWFDFQYQHELVDDQAYMNRYRQDSSVVGIATAKPADRIRIRVRSRYLFEDISDNERLEQLWWTYVDFWYRLRARDKLRLRYDLVVHLDDRMNTQLRSPSPEHWLWLDYEARF